MAFVFLCWKNQAKIIRDFHMGNFFHYFYSGKLMIMNKGRYALRFAGCAIILMIIACNCKKVGYDYSGVYLNQYYKFQISKNETACFMFFRADSIISGEYFIHKGNAVVEKLPFNGRPVREKTIINFIEPERIHKTKGVLTAQNDTVFYSYGKGKKKTSLKLVRENIKRPLIFKNRYHEPIFKNVRKRELNYGKARGFYTSKPVHKIGREQYVSIILEVGKSLAKNFLMSEQNLDMDLYQPVGDTLGKRPLLLLIHGGAFIIGDKDTKTMHAIAGYFARRGFVVAAINYRLGYIFVPGGYVYLERCIYRAVQDARASVRYLVHHAGQFGIDPEYVFIAGNSAGGFTALKTAFMEQKEAFKSAGGNPYFFREDLGCLDCSGNNLKTKFKIRGVINMWGALTDTSMISADEKIPLLSFHGDADDIVPPGHEYPFANVGSEFTSFFSRKTFGSVAIHDHMENLGIKNKLVLFPGAGHDPQISEDNILNENMQTILENMNDFLLEIILEDSSVLRGKSEYGFHDPTALFEVSGKGFVTAKWEVTGGKLLGTRKNGQQAEVVWFADETVHKIRCVAMNENGLVNTIDKYISLK
jgi:pimeloyl-ACP methyl ester carboxylesterase